MLKINQPRRFQREEWVQFVCGHTNDTVKSVSLERAVTAASPDQARPPGQSTQTQVDAPHVVCSSKKV